MLLAAPFAWLIERVPFLKRLHLDPDTIRRRLGLLGEPIILGFIIGFLLALLAGQPPVAILNTAINIAAVMLIIPRMVAILMEGLTPVAEAARNFMTKRFAGRKFYIGLDSAVLIGNQSVIAAGLLMVPVEIALALLLSLLGNRTLPYLDYVTILTTEPEFPECPFLPLVLPKIQAAAEFARRRQPELEIVADGGIDAENVREVVQAGATVVVSGRGIFRPRDIMENVQQLRHAAGESWH